MTKIFKSALMVIAGTLLFGGAITGQITVPSPTPMKSDLDAVYEDLLKEPAWLYGEDVCPFSVIPKEQISKEKYLLSPALCAVEAKSCVEKCRDGDGVACYAMALTLQSNKGLEQTVSERFFLRGCKYGVPSACTNRAAFILNVGERDDKSVKCAVDTFEKTCELDDPWGCVMFARALYAGWSRPKNDELALKSLANVCKYGDADEACVAGKKLGEIIRHERTKVRK